MCSGPLNVLKTTSCFMCFCSEACGSITTPRVSSCFPPAAQYQVQVQLCRISICLKCVCLLGVPLGSQLSAPATPLQDIWVLRSSPTGKSVWPQTPANTPSPSHPTLLYHTTNPMILCSPTKSSSHNVFSYSSTSR